MDYQLQVITLSVSDVDKPAAFYTQQVGFADPDGNTWVLQEIGHRPSQGASGGQSPD